MKIKTIKKSQIKYKEIRKFIYQIMDCVYKVHEIRDPYTARHQKKVAFLSSAIAKEMGLPDDQIEGIYLACLIHDVGKISIPMSILSKPINVNNEEFNLIKNHPKVGSEIIKDVDSPWPIVEMVLQHHERLDGSGYPSGLNDKEIILEAKIIGVADIVEAISSHRPYRPGLGIVKALEEIIKNKGILYDQKVVDTCVKIFKEEKFKF